MHYYQHNIGDYRRDTNFLTLLEHGVYRQLLDQYYLNEKPLSCDLDKIYRLIMAKTEQEQEATRIVLSDFFMKTEDGYIHKRCDDTINEFQNKSEKAREAAQVRWSNANAMQTHSKRNANGMLTNNHKPINNNRSPAKPEDVNEEVWTDWLSLRRVKKAPVTATALTRLRAEATKAGLSLQDALTQCVANGWQGFEAEWIKKRATPVVERRGI